MTSPPDGNPGGTQGSSRVNRPGAQGASRGGVNPEDSADEGERRSHDPSDRSFDPDAAYDRPRYSSSAGSGGSDAPFGGYPFGGPRASGSSGGWRSKFGGDAKFLGLPVGLIYALGAAILAIVFVGAVCGAPTKTGSVAGQVKQMSADRTVTTLPGAELTLRGGGNTYTATSTDVDPNADGDAAYNYRFENVPPGNYALEVKPPAGANLQPEDGLNLEVKSGQMFPQSVMLLAEGVQKPRELAQNELQPGEAGGYVDDKGQRHTYQQGSGFDASDALLMYLLWRNPPGWGYGAPPIIGNSNPGSSYRVSNPPTQTRSGQAVTQRPTTPGQGATRPSSGSGATGSAPSRSSSGPDAVAPSTGSGSSAGSSTGSGSNTQTQPSTGAGSSTTTRPNVPSQGTTRPSSSSSSPSRSSAPSRSSGGGRR